MFAYFNEFYWYSRLTRNLKLTLLISVLCALFFTAFQFHLPAPNETTTLAQYLIGFAARASQLTLLFYLADYIKTKLKD
jgi:hypothetical protein